MSRSRHIQKLDVLHQLVIVRLTDAAGQRGIVDGDRLHLDLCLAVVAAAVHFHLAGVAVVHAPEIVAVQADGPVHGAGADAQHVFKLLHQRERILAGAVKLVYEGENRYGAHAANPEQLHRLLLNALGAVDQHHGAVGGDEGAVGVLGKVLVTGGVQNIDAVAVEIELHRGRGDGNAALLFNLHPVAGCVAGGLARLDGTGLTNRAAVQKQLLGQRGFAGVGVGYDGERAPAARFGGKLGMGHGYSSSFFKMRKREASMRYQSPDIS